MILVCAPAGFGKTALPAPWASAGPRPLAWLSLDEADNDPARFWRHVAAALERARPGITAGSGRIRRRCVVSYHLCYRSFMAQRQKRSVSLPPELARAVEDAARAEGTTFSAWLAQTAAHRLKLEAGQKALTEWEQENGPLTEAELAVGRARARASLGRAPAGPAERKSA